MALSGLAEGSYTLTSYDPQTATWTGEDTVQVSGGAYVIELPALALDLAFKLTKQ